MHHFQIHPHQNILVKDIVRSTLHYTSQRWTWFCFQHTKLCYGFPSMLLRWGFWRGILTEFWHACVLADVTGAVHAIRVTLCDTASCNMSHASICSLNRISNYYIHIYIYTTVYIDYIYIYIIYRLYTTSRSRYTQQGHLGDDRIIPDPCASSVARIAKPEGWPELRQSVCKSQSGSGG